MSRLRRDTRPSIFTEDVVERHLLAMRADIEPDPLFRRRLRSRVVNTYVAGREGHGTNGLRAGRTMGRLGRAVLYSTFAFGVSVTGVMAASQQALPGTALYPLKRHVEDLRVAVLPGHLHDDLVLLELSERIAEVAALVERGEPTIAMAMVDAIGRDYGTTTAIAADAAQGPVGRHIAVLNSRLETLPHAARVAVMDRLAAIPGLGEAVSAGAGTGLGPPSGGSDGSPPRNEHAATPSDSGEKDGEGRPAAGPPGARPANAAAPTVEPTPRADARPSRRPTASPSPAETPSQKAEPSRRPAPDPTPRAAQPAARRQGN